MLKWAAAVMEWRIESTTAAGRPKASSPKNIDGRPLVEARADALRETPASCRIARNRDRETPGPAAGVVDADVADRTRRRENGDAPATKSCSDFGREAKGGANDEILAGRKGEVEGLAREHVVLQQGRRPPHHRCASPPNDSHRRIIDVLTDDFRAVSAVDVIQDCIQQELRDVDAGKASGD